MKTGNKKVIGFDSWTGGAPYCQLLLPALAARSIEYTLVHIGSWGNELGCPQERKIGDLLVRDVSFYGGDSFERILDVEKPDAVIFTSTQTFAHRALIRYCKQRAIPTLNLYHGLVNVQFTDGEIETTTISRLAYAKYVLSRVGKLLRHTFPCYIGALLKTKATYKDWSRFISDIYQLASGNLSTKASDDAKTDKCAVFTPADVEHAMRCYGFKEGDVFVVGNPDLLHFGLTQDMVGSWGALSNPITKSIMYIETGFGSIGLYFEGAQGFVNHIIGTHRALAEQGYTLCVKLKPNQAHNRFIESRLKDAGIELVTNNGFLTKLFQCSACIAETTTLSILPALIGMPLFLANYGSLNALKYGTVLTSYPRGYLLHDIFDVAGILFEDAQALDKGKLHDWMNLNVGPLPPEKMPARVASVVDDMIEKKHSQKLK